jgi:hypothetical protein
LTNNNAIHALVPFWKVTIDYFGGDIITLPRRHIHFYIQIGKGGIDFGGRRNKTKPGIKYDFSNDFALLK